MRFVVKYQLNSWLPQLNPQIWILGIGRFISQLGIGFTLFYTTIFFVNQLGFPATTVGLALGSGAIAGVLGRLTASSLCNWQFCGRRGTLLLSAAISAIASCVFSTTNNFPTLVVGNLLMGFGQGLYWPAIDTVITDLMPAEQCRETFALMRMMDYVGLGIGILLGGEIIGWTGAYRVLFLLNATGFIVFFLLVYAKVTETYQPHKSHSRSGNGWAKALSDRRLLVYILVNVIFTVYASEFQAVLPLYLKNFVSLDGSPGHGFSEPVISALFGWHIAIAIVCQLPITRVLKSLSPPHAMICSALMWALGFVAVWGTAVSESHHLGWAILALEMFAIAAVSHTPAAVSIVNSLASPSQRSVYFAIHSLCGSAGFFIGPLLGTWILDRLPHLASVFWLCLAVSVLVTVVILQYLHHLLRVR